MLNEKTNQNQIQDELNEDQIIRKGYYLGHKVVQGKKDPNKKYCFVDLLFVSKKDTPEEYHTITTTFCDLENEPKDIKRLAEVKCLFEQGSDPTKPARFIKIV